MNKSAVEKFACAVRNWRAGNTIATHLFRFFFQSLRLEGYSTPDAKRNFLFYLLYPFMVIYSLINIPITLLLGWGDLTEDANNFLVVARKLA